MTTITHPLVGTYTLNVHAARDRGKWEYTASVTVDEPFTINRVEMTRFYGNLTRREYGWNWGSPWAVRKDGKAVPQGVMDKLYGLLREVIADLDNVSELEYETMRRDWLSRELNRERGKLAEQQEKVDALSAELDAATEALTGVKL